MKEHYTKSHMQMSLVLLLMNIALIHQKTIMRRGKKKKTTTQTHTHTRLFNGQATIDGHTYSN